MNIKRMLIGKARPNSGDLIKWAVIAGLLWAFNVELELWGYFVAIGSVIALILIAAFTGDKS